MDNSKYDFSWMILILGVMLSGGEDWLKEEIERCKVGARIDEYVRMKGE